MAINGGDPLVCARLQQLARDDLLDGQHHTVLASDADGCASVLDGFDGVFHLPV